MPTDYSKTKIYLIKSPNTDMVYVGETVQELKERFRGHKKDKDCTAKIILAAGDAYIELYENYPCNSKSDSCKREKEIIKIFGDKCVNILRYSNMKEYCDANRDKINEKQRLYTINNREIINAKLREKRKSDDNREKIREQRRTHYEKNKVEINAKRRADRVAKKLLLVA